MNNFGDCRYCGSELISEIYKIGKGKGIRLIVYCRNDECSVQLCTNDTASSIVIEELKYFSV